MYICICVCEYRYGYTCVRTCMCMYMYTCTYIYRLFFTFHLFVNGCISTVISTRHIGRRDPLKRHFLPTWWIASTGAPYQSWAHVNASSG